LSVTVRLHIFSCCHDKWSRRENGEKVVMVLDQFRLVVGLEPLEELTVILEFEQLLQLRSLIYTYTVCTYICFIR
jgi:hypothetical protein